MTVLEVDQLEGYLNGIVYFFANDSFSDGLNACKKAIGENFIEIFANRQGLSGNAWPAHAPATVQRYGVHPLLILTGTMYTSVTTSGSTGHYEMVGNREMEWGTTQFYAGWNNDGTSRIPAREFMYWTENGADGVVDALASYVGGRI